MAATDSMRGMTDAVGANMIDLKDFREYPDKYRHAAEVKRVNVDVDQVLHLDGHPAVVGDEWSDFLPDSKDLISDWRKPMSCGNFNVATGKCGGKGS